MEYGWPGNVRELQNVVERALNLNRNRLVHFNHINLPYHSDLNVNRNPHVETKNCFKTLDELILPHIRQVLKETKGKIHGPGGTAELLGMNPSTLRNRMNKLGIQYGKGDKHS